MRVGGLHGCHHEHEDNREQTHSSHQPAPICRDPHQSFSPTKGTAGPTIVPLDEYLRKRALEKCVFFVTSYGTSACPNVENQQGHYDRQRHSPTIIGTEV